MFTFLSLVLGGAFVAAATAGLHGGTFSADSLVRVPRARVAGEILGIVCLVWSAYHASLMLEGHLAGLRKYIWLLVPVTALLAYSHVEYLFSRALGGFLVLSVTAMVHGAFAEQILFRPLYALVCYLVGFWGLVLIGLPWRFRDLLLLMCRSRPWRRRVSAVWLAVGTVFVVMPLLR